MEHEGESRVTHARRTIAPHRAPSWRENEDGATIDRLPTQRVASPRTAQRTIPRPFESTALSRPLSCGADLDNEEHSTLLLRSAPVTRQSRTLVPVAAPSGSDRLSGFLRWSRYIAFGVVLLAAVLAFAYSTVQAQQNTQVHISATPPPTGRGPWSTLSSVAVAPPPLKAATTEVSNGTYGVTGTMGSIEPCHDQTMFVSSISQWAVPPGCYGLIYTPNPANYVQRPGFGWCNWWVRVSHPNHPDITENTSYPRGTKPVAGAAIFFDGNEQGAGSEGHWAEAVAVAPDGYWVLISEMNFAWRGAGFGKIDYRYIHVSPGVHFVYA